MRVENAVGIIGVALLALGPGMDLRGGFCGRACWTHVTYGLVVA